MSLLRQIWHLIPMSGRMWLLGVFRALKSRNSLVRWVHLKTVMRRHIFSRPRGVTIELTDKCNLKCTYCPKSLDIGMKGAHMDFALFKTAIDQAVLADTVDLVPLVGFGEPFLYPHLEQAVVYVKQKSPKSIVSLTSNGTLLNDGWGERLAKAGLNSISISVNATSREQYRRINASDQYDAVVQNTKDFIAAVNATDSNMKIAVQVLAGVNDEAQIASFVEYWTPHLGRSAAIQIQPFVNWAGQIDTESVLEREEKARRGEPIPEGTGSLIRQLKDRKRDVASPFEYDKKHDEEPYPCLHIMSSRIITREGDALACCMVIPEERGDLDLGNIRDRNMSELYSSERLKHYRRLNMEGRLGEVKPCDTCNVWSTVPNVWIKNPLHRFVGRKWY